MLQTGFAETFAAARTGADWAWARLYREYAPALLGFLRGRGADDAENVLGEVFLQAVRDLHGFDGGEPEFRAWLFTIARHRAIDEARRRKRRPEQLVAEGPDDAVCFDEPLAGLSGEWLRGIIEQLSRDQRDVLLLRLVGDLTVDDVARALGKSPGAVKALQRRGLETVARELAAQGVTL